MRAANANDVLCISCSRRLHPSFFAQRTADGSQRGVCHDCARAQPLRHWWTSPQRKPPTDAAPTPQHP